jgi:excisionase family DNA binding protein
MGKTQSGKTCDVECIEQTTQPEYIGNSNLAVFENRILNEWLTTEEAAEYLRISPKYLLNLSSNGRVRYYKFGRRNRFLLSDLKELLLAQPRGAVYGN